MDRSSGSRADKALLKEWASTLIEVGCLDRLEGFELNDLGTCGRGLARHVSESTFAQEAMMFIAQTFDRLRQQVDGQAGLKPKRLYLEIHTQVTSLREWLKQNKVPVQAVDDKISEVLASFTLSESIKAELQRYEVTWPSLAASADAVSPPRHGENT
jgi:hypothetical protein